MKKIIMVFVLLFFLTAPALRAQVFVGGGFGINGSSTKYESGSTTSDGIKGFSIYFGPRVGYFLSEKFAVGAGIGLNSSKTTNPNYGEGDDLITKSTGWSIEPFARYYCMKNGPFSVFTEGYLSLGGYKQKETYGSTTNDTDKVFSFYGGISPAVSYDLSEKFTLEAYLGGLSIGTSVSKDPEDEDSKATYNSWGLNFDLNDIYVGLIYKLK